MKDIQTIFTNITSTIAKSKAENEYLNNIHSTILQHRSESESIIHSINTAINNCKTEYHTVNISERNINKYNSALNDNLSRFSSNADLVVNKLNTKTKSLVKHIKKTILKCKTEYDIFDSCNNAIKKNTILT